MTSWIVRIDVFRQYGNAWFLASLAALLAAGCQRQHPDEASAPQGPRLEAAAMKPKEDAPRRFDHILEMLLAKDEKVRENGMKDLADFQKDMKDPGSQIGLKALRAAARPYPFDKPEPGVVSAQLVAVADATPLPEYIPVVVELFDKFSDDAKLGAQVLLTELQSREAAEAFMTIVRTHAPTGNLPSLFSARLVNKPRHADVFFPEILKYAGNRKLSSEIHRLCLAYCQAKLLAPAMLAPFSDQVLKSYIDLAETLRPAQRDQGIAWMWEEEYQESRSDAALLLDLLGHFVPVHCRGTFWQRFRNRGFSRKAKKLAQLRGRTVPKLAVWTFPVVMVAANAMP